MSEAAQAADQNQDYDQQLDDVLAKLAGRAEPAAVETQPQAEPEQEQEQQPAEVETPPQDDKLARLLAELEAERAQNQQLQHRLKSESGRQAALQRKLQEQRESAPKVGLSDEDLAAMEQELSDLSPATAKAIRQLLTANQAVAQHVEQAVAPVYEAQMRQEQERAHEAEQAAIRRLLELHPDVGQVKESPEFRQWLGALPADLQHVANSSRDPETVALLISQFKQGRAAAIEQLQATKQQKLANSVGVPGSSAPPAAPTINAESYEAELNRELKRLGV